MSDSKTDIEGVKLGENYDLTEQVMSEIWPLVEEIHAKCAAIGVPLLAAIQMKQAKNGGTTEVGINAATYLMGKSVSVPMRTAFAALHSDHAATIAGALATCKDPAKVIKEIMKGVLSC